MLVCEFHSVVRANVFSIKKKITTRKENQRKTCDVIVVIFQRLDFVIFHVKSHAFIFNIFF